MKIYKKYLLIVWSEKSGAWNGADFDKKYDADKVARKNLKDGWSGVAMVDTRRNTVLETFGDFPDLKTVFNMRLVRDVRPKPSSIRNLAQFKKVISMRYPFEIVKHYVRPECDGQIRVPNIVQTTGFYSVVKDEPQHKVSTANDGKGYWMSYAQAKNWEFKSGKILALTNCGDPIMEIRFI